MSSLSTREPNNLCWSYPLSVRSSSSLTFLIIISPILSSPSFNIDCSSDIPLFGNTLLTIPCSIFLLSTTFFAYCIYLSYCILFNSSSNTFLSVLAYFNDFILSISLSANSLSLFILLFLLWILGSPE